jgi:guanine deaminase
MRGDLVTCTSDRRLVHVRDGVVVVNDGVIEQVGPASETLSPGLDVTHYPDCLIAPGFVDAHVHYVQTEIVGTPGGRLLDWLKKGPYEAEQRFRDRAHADRVAGMFFDELLRNGTTSAMVFCATYPQSVDALFEEAAKRNVRVIAGKTWMDRNAPEPLLDTAQSAYDDSKALYARWHGKGRAGYAITPRFAPTSSEAQLDAAGALLKEHPDAWVQTHISENAKEVRWVHELFPDRKDYLDVYGHHGLLGRRTLLAHGVHMNHAEFARCAQSGAALAHCPTSNLFLGSGLLDLAGALDAGVRVGLGTDIGAGTSFSLLRTLDEASKVANLRGAPLDPATGFWLATRGGANALDLDDRVGALEPGLEADLVVLDPRATPLLELRTKGADSIEDVLFALMTLGDDRAVRATYVAGALAHERRP